jgi:uncharacterized protein with FMN-binding domain
MSEDWLVPIHQRDHARNQHQMKKLIVSIVIVGTFFIYSFLHAHSNLFANAPDIGAPAIGGTIAGTPVVGNGTTTASTQYKDGSYTGLVADAQWGYVQIKAVIQHGKITDVQFVDYPHDRSRSVYINQIADPELVSEALQAQSAQVDAITGATDSSYAFMQSLDNALSQAAIK